MKHNTEGRTCPVCGNQRLWSFGAVRHWLDGVKYVHVKFVNEGEHRVCILANGVALEK